jgi:glycosyltransferase involved in cell wall biosynthesis
MRIGIDARFYGSIGKGLGRYTQKLIENLEMADGDNEYFIFLRKDNFTEFNPRNKNFKKVLADFRWYSVVEQFSMPFMLLRYKLDVVHFPHFNVPLFYRKKFIVTIHDLILLHFPTLRGTRLSRFVFWLKFFFYKIIIRSAIDRSARVITVSNFTKDDILRNYGVDSGKIAVTYESWMESIASSPEKEDKHILSRYGIIGPYLLYVGNAYPHKNLEIMLSAFQEILKVRKGLQLILVGREDYFYRQLKGFAKDKHMSGIIFAGFVPDDDLGCVYRNAALYVFPSLYEGFGLPPLEAMAYGVPVISSGYGSMPEILGESVKYFDAKKMESVIAAILEIMDNAAIREELIRRGRERVKFFSWRKMAEETKKIYLSS